MKARGNISAPFSRFVIQESSSWWYSGASFLVVTELCMVTGVY